MVYKRINGTKLPKDSLSNNTRDLIESLAQEACDRKHENTVKPSCEIAIL